MDVFFPFQINTIQKNKIKNEENNKSWDFDKKNVSQ